jgi:hypothetical protein
LWVALARQDIHADIMRKALVISAVLLGLCAAFCAGWFSGGRYTYMKVTERRYNQDVEFVMPGLAADPAFRRLETFDFPVNGFCLQGSVATQADYDRLWAEVLRLLGESRVGHVMADVWIEGIKDRPIPTPNKAGSR